MGSKSRRHSTGPKAIASHSRQGKSSTSKRRKRDASPPGLRAIHGQFANALSFVSTATHTLIATEDRVDETTRYDASETIHTLRHGLNELNRVYNDLDHAIREAGE